MLCLSSYLPVGMCVMSDSTVKEMMDRAIAFAKPFAPEIIWECGACGAYFPGEEQPPHCYNCVACGYSPNSMRLHKLLDHRAVPPPEYTPPRDDDDDDGEPFASLRR